MTGTLFNLDDYETPRQVHDSYWDEIVLDCSGKVDDNGQATLFYDDTSEAPDPDDYPSRAEYLRAWIEWEEKFPQNTPVQSSWLYEYQGYQAKFNYVRNSKKGHVIQFGVTNLQTGLMAGTWFNDFYPTAIHAELVFVEHIDKWHSAAANPTETEKVVLEEPVKGFHFEEGVVYWHSSRKLKFKITRLLASVSKAQGYFAGKTVKEKVFLSELVPVENQEEVATLPEQVDSVLEKPVINQWVERYYVLRSGKKYWYDRYCYYQKKIKHIHIPSKPDLKEMIEKAIAQHQLPSEIEKLIKSSC